MLSALLKAGARRPLSLLGGGGGGGCRPHSTAAPGRPCREDSVKLSATPKSGLTDEEIHIEVTGLCPRQPVTLRVLVSNDRGHFFDSCAQYQADSRGVVDLRRAPSLGGDYVGVEPMGLLWSLSPAAMERPYQRLIAKDPATCPMGVEIFVHDGHSGSGVLPGLLLAKDKVERWFAKPGLRKIRLREGRLRGTLFMPPGDGPFPGVIDMFGDVGGLTEFRSCLLASRGFCALALPYFGFEDLPMNMKEFHLEYFESAANYLQKYPKVKGPGIGVLGSSKGGDLALSMATFLPNVAATVCISSCNANTESELHYKDWTKRGLTYDMDKIVLLKTGILNIYESLENPMAEKNKDTIIPIEKAEGQFLFVVGEDDKIWKSSYFAEQAIKRLKEHGKSNYELLSYPGAGHHIEPPCSPYCYARIDRLFGLPIVGGGNAKDHAHAQQDSWQKIQNFFRLHLCGSEVECT
ncbi:acyl-coenzyme A thioesterase 1 [Callorhinchus milii]|uniref:Acyl-coenzyme A thioesterase 1-like n=1 Tax=Callorhinchus milii TaxID=7868 RepID=A0A4W3I7Z7_CALMI|nr:acyl-coenzyme A thioesterase 1 [Callorhinchus milii]|eukprot:gi/632942249/ref/XP_007886309.1/ PREDICTED: acyl-coenzyme A thioesterase 1-like [Callorhinchus milii]